MHISRFVFLILMSILKNYKKTNYFEIYPVLALTIYYYYNILLKMLWK